MDKEKGKRERTMQKAELKKKSVEKEQTEMEYLQESIDVVNNQIIQFQNGVQEINVLLEYYNKKDDKDKPKFVNRMNQLLQEKKKLNERIKAGRYDLDKIRNIVKMIK